ncbi:GNAT family acetyltransferase [Methylobacillus sp. MM3]|uniref:GNAT family N-acetyltransferase n=1 Tax=Methylobacillus sp. MM3 TaxID=1848039 RepID=UPI0007DFA34A|nr:GNAT family N-acetyltransferase [Methylobacillus sp. MM3]OAJ69990.1 GNAT family acetyltransferase [Methylobacillus sp. MM3]
MSFSVIAVDWLSAGAALAEIRRRVFIEEQSVPEALEWDGLDENAVHVLASDDANRPIGCARLLPQGKIGRMAVLPEWRGSGVGRTMLETLVALARAQGLPEVSLSAQTHAIPFYEQAGFRVCSEIYDDAGIPHRDMVLALSA